MQMHIPWSFACQIRDRGCCLLCCLWTIADPRVGSLLITTSLCLDDRCSGLEVVEYSLVKYCSVYWQSMKRSLSNLGLQLHKDWGSDNLGGRLHDHCIDCRHGFVLCLLCSVVSIWFVVLVVHLVGLIFTSRCCSLFCGCRFYLSECGSMFALERKGFHGSNKRNTIFITKLKD